MCAGAKLPGGLQGSSVQGSATDLPQGAYIPFSYGPRDCAGKRMGMLQVHTLLSAKSVQTNCCLAAK